MINNSKKIFVTRHCHNQLRLSDDCLLHSLSGEDPDVVSVSAARNPLASLCNSLDMLLVLHFEVPLTVLLVGIERSEVQVAAFSVNFFLL